MPDVTFTVSADVIDDLAIMFNYNPATDGLKGAFVRTKMLADWKERVKNWRQMQAMLTAKSGIADPNIT